VVRAWIGQAPSWLEILSPVKSADAELAQLDDGERDAILLAEELRADQIVIGEIHGRREAQRCGLPFIGTLGVLAAGAKRGLLDLRIAVDRLRLTNFYISPDVLERIMGIE
jgi:predicted nucleic acid-binding protein